MDTFLKPIFILLVCINLSHTSEDLPLETSQTIQMSRRQLSCFCKDGICQCCATIQAPRLNFVQTGCLEVTYTQEDLALSMSFTLNGTSVWHNKVSGRNPPPICVALPQFPFIRLCLVLKDIKFENDTLHICPDLDIRVPIDITILVISFDCLQIGANGVTFIKPSHDNTTIADSE